MDRHLNVRKSAFLGMKLLISLAAFLFAAGNVYALQCNSCHNMPPIDSVAGNRDQTTGAFKGNHTTHAAVAKNSCIPCHGAGVLAYTAAHSSYTSASRTAPRILIASKINNYSAAGVGNAKYNKGVFFNQTSLPVTSGSTCSNVNCHFEAATPAWGSANFTSPTDCNQCHGAPPSGGTTGAAGSHAKHDTYYSGAANCAKCHSDHTAETNKFAHATSAGKRSLSISFAAAPNSGSGAYSGPLNDYLPSQANTFGNCTATYCHSPGTSASPLFTAPNQAATWGGSLTCKGCHKESYDGTSNISSGSHTKHVNGMGLGYNTVKCVTCHQSTATAGMTIADRSMHVNKKVEVAFNNTSSAANGSYNGQLAKPGSPSIKDPGTVVGSCTSVYCHSTGQGANGTWPPTYQSPRWGTAADGKCGTCHGVDSGQHSSQAIANTIASGSHTKHLSYTFGIFDSAAQCAACHSSSPGLAKGAGCQSAVCHTNMASKHANYEINVGIPALFGASATYNGTTKPGDGYSTCSNVSCHYNTTTPAWGTAAPINCFGCHTFATLGGSHSKHISSSLTPTMYNYTANRSTTAEYDFGCSNCHPVVTTNHMNGIVNITLNKNDLNIGSLRTKNNTTGTGIGFGIAGTTKSNIVCSAAYCHSNGNAAALVYATTPNWYGGTFTGDKCANCHGNAPNSTIAGSKSHYNNKFLGYTSNAGGHQIGIHAMKIYSSPSGLAQAGTVGSSSHGNAGTSTTISCNICHYATVATARNDNNGVCKTCHISGNTVGAQFGNVLTITNKSKHVNGTADIAFRPISTLSKAQMRTGSFNQSLYSSVWKRNVGYKANGAYDSAKGALNTTTMWNGTTKTCSNIACHNGQSVKWSDNGGTTSCVSCHTAL